jgi:hypothetical protein
LLIAAKSFVGHLFRNHRLVPRKIPRENQCFKNYFCRISKNGLCLVNYSDCWLYY